LVVQRLSILRAIAWAALIAMPILGLDACRTLPVPMIAPWPEQRAALQALASYQFRGQLAAATATEGFSAALNWQQAGATSDAQLRAPFGVGGARLQFDGAQLQMTASNGVALGGAAAHEAMINLLGFEPPLASLRYWLLGVPDPAAPGVEMLDDAQHLQRLQQSEWQIDYADYARQGRQWLPGLITLRRDNAKLKVHISHWQLP
jgi:outer membrane lipoprotein LolB